MRDGAVQRSVGIPGQAALTIGSVNGPFAAATSPARAGGGHRLFDGFAWPFVIQRDRRQGMARPGQRGIDRHCRAQQGAAAIATKVRGDTGIVAGDGGLQGQTQGETVQRLKAASPLPDPARPTLAVRQ